MLSHASQGAKSSPACSPPLYFRFHLPQKLFITVYQPLYLQPNSTSKMTNLAELPKAELVAMLMQEKASHDVTKAELKVAAAMIQNLHNSISCSIHNISDDASSLLSHLSDNTLSLVSPNQGPEDCDEGVITPMYKDIRNMDREKGSCTKRLCTHLLQNQINKFPAEDIDALYPTRKAAQQAWGKRC
jgi:hypothetical protein